MGQKTSKSENLSESIDIEILQKLIQKIKEMTISITKLEQENETLKQRISTMEQNASNFI